METNPQISAFATALFLALVTPGCAASLQPAEPQVSAAYLPVETVEGEAVPARRPELPMVIHARAFGESRGASESPVVANVPFLAPDTTHAGAEPCRLVAIPEGAPLAAPALDRATDEGQRSGALAASAHPSGIGGRPQPPTVTVTGFRGRAPVDIAWAFPVPPSRNGAPAPAAPTGKTLVQMALYDALPVPDAKPRSVLQCTSEIDSIAWAVPRAMVDELLGARISPGAVVRVSVARAPGKLTEVAPRAAGQRFAVGAFVDLPVERDRSLSRR